MNKLVVYIVCIVALTNANKRLPKKSVHLLEHDRLDDQWSEFKLKFNKTYNNLVHESYRKQVFSKTIAKINELNKNYNDGIISHISGINNFSDWTSQEFMAFLNQSSIKIVENLKKESEIKYKKKQKKLSIKSIDWRKKGVVNPVKSQGSCGCCWAFGTTSAIESHVAIKFGFLPNLSEQNLADCVYDRNGQDCRGGMPSTAFDYIKNNGGIDTQEGYPYTSFNSSKTTRCNYQKKFDSGIRVTGFKQLPPNDEEALAEAVSNIGPVVVCIQATDYFAHYHSGVYTDPLCDGSVNRSVSIINHVVTVVGLGTDSESGKDYYIVRNSWGTYFGIDGYYYFERNNNNMCSISSWAYYPYVEMTNSQPDQDDQKINWQDEESYSWSYSCDFLGNDLSHIYQPNTKDHCSGTCAKTKGCTHFTWNGHTSICHIKHGSVSKSDAFYFYDKSIACGLITDSEKDQIEWQDEDSYSWSYSCDFLGNDLSHKYHSKTEDHCSFTCAKTKGCTHFTWQGQNNFCLMKSGSVSKSDAIYYNDKSVVCGVMFDFD